MKKVTDSQLTPSQCSSPQHIHYAAQIVNTSLTHFSTYNTHTHCAIQIVNLHLHSAIHLNTCTQCNADRQLLPSSQCSSLRYFHPVHACRLSSYTYLVQFSFAIHNQLPSTAEFWIQYSSISRADCKYCVQWELC